MVLMTMLIRVLIMMKPYRNPNLSYKLLADVSMMMIYFSTSKERCNKQLSAYTRYHMLLVCISPTFIDPQNEDHNLYLSVFDKRRDLINNFFMMTLQN